MSNPDFNDDPNKRRDNGPKFKDNKPGPMGKVKEKTASWPGLPGKTGPDRGFGVKKLKTYPSSKGI